MKKLFTILVALSIYSSIQAQTTTSLGSGASSAGSANTAIGAEAGYIGDGNTSIGAYAGNSVSGFNNTAVGRSAGGIGNLSGNLNTFFGAYSGYNSSTGNSNVFGGFEAGYYNTAGSFNLFIGSVAGRSNTTGQRNTFLGFSSGNNNLTAVDNVFIGYSAGSGNQINGNNTYIGSNAGMTATGASNTFVGKSAGANGFGPGSSNSFFGESSGLYNTGNHNTFLGTKAGYFNTDGSRNVFLGRDAGFDNVSGSDNLFLGDQAGAGYKGSRSIFLGHQSGISGDLSDKLSIGKAYNNFIPVFGDLKDRQLGINVHASDTDISNGFRFYVNGSTLDTRRYFITDNQLVDDPDEFNGMSILEKLAPRTHSYVNKSNMDLPTGYVYGLTYDDLPQSVIDRLQKTDIHGYRAMDSDGLMAILVQAVKELSNQLQVVQNDLNQVTGKSATKQNETTSKNLSTNTISTLNNALSIAPNPTTGLTKVIYNVPDQAKRAALTITDNNGVSLFTFSQLNKGKSEVSIDASQLASGVYLCILIIDGNVAGTARMVISQ